jgi:hypothetical protein
MGVLILGFKTLSSLYTHSLCPDFVHNLAYSLACGLDSVDNTAHPGHVGPHAVYIILQHSWHMDNNLKPCTYSLQIY